MIASAAQTPAVPNRVENSPPTFEESVTQGLSDFTRGAFKPIPMASREALAEPLAESPDYCVATFSSAPESAPKFWFSIRCGSRAPFSSPSRWCWALRDSKHRECVSLIVSDMLTLMREKGYSDIGRFKNGGEADHYFLFQKPGTNQNRDKGYCLAHRVPVWRSGFGGVAKINYRIDCGDNSLTNLNDAETDLQGTSGIVAYMSRAGYALRDSHDEKNGFHKLIFSRP